MNAIDLYSNQNSSK